MQSEFGIQAVEIGSVPLGGGAPLVLISGLNVLEAEDAAVAT